MYKRKCDVGIAAGGPPLETEQVLGRAAGLGLFAATTLADMSGNRDLAAACLDREREFAATRPK